VTPAEIIAALEQRLRKHDNGSHQQCTCRSSLDNCMACDCFLAAECIERLVAENAKLRAALESIARLGVNMRADFSRSADQSRIAREALA
jgi:hypothetical protein